MSITDIGFTSTAPLADPILSILDRIDCGIFILAVAPDRMLRLTLANAVFLDAVGLPAGSSLGLQPGEFLPQDFAEALQANCDFCLERQQPIGFNHALQYQSDWRIIGITLSPVIDREGKISQIVGSCFDITQQSQQLPQAIGQEKFQKWIEENPDGVIVVDRQGIVRFVNRAAEQLFRRKAEELVGELFGLPVVAGERTDIDIIRKGGETTSAEMRVVETQNEGEITHVIASLRDITERKQVEESLRLRERAIAASSNGIVITDATKPDHPIIYANPGFERITGYSVAEAIGRNCRFLQGHETNQPGLDEIRNSIRAQRECHAILSNYRKDGTQFWNELYISPVFNERGELSNFIGIQTDITERVKSEEHLRDSEAKLRTILAAVKDGITFSDASGHFEVFNPEMENLTGYSMAEANACEDFTWLLYPNPGDRGLALQGLQRLEREGTIDESETTIHTKSGEIKNVLVSSALVMYGGKRMFLTAYRDITERKKAEEKLRLQNEREHLLGGITLRIQRELNLEQILTVTVEETRKLLRTDRVVIYKFQPGWSGSFVVESLEPDCLSVLGASVYDPTFAANYILQYQHGRISAMEDILSDSVHSCHRELLAAFQIRANLVVPIVYSDKLWGLLLAHQCFAPRQWQEFEIDLLRQLANNVAIAIQQAELFERVQALNTELRALNTDLERQVAERTVELSQALAKEKELSELKSRFVSTTSHEFRTPLATIMAASELLKRHGQNMTEEKKRERLNKIQTEIKNMTELLEEVLTIGRVSSGKLVLRPARVNLEEFCRNILDEIQLLAADNHEIVFASSGNCTNAVVDAKLLRQVLVNLLSNAVKYSPKGGRIEFQLSCQTDLITFQIRDEGIGIPSKDLSLIFDSFYRAENAGNVPGTGLGLAIAKEFADLHGGKIYVDSKVDVGTTFTVTIPNRE